MTVVILEVLALKTPIWRCLPKESTGGKSEKVAERSVDWVSKLGSRRKSVQKAREGVVCGINQLRKRRVSGGRDCGVRWDPPPASHT